MRKALRLYSSRVQGFFILEIGKNSLDQWWATLFGLRATLKTKLVYAGQYKYYIDLYDLTFERKWAYSSLFSKRNILREAFLMLLQLKKCSRATLRCSVGRMWPAGRTLPRPTLDYCMDKWSHSPWAISFKFQPSCDFCYYFSGTHYHDKICNPQSAAREVKRIVRTAKRFLFPKELIFVPMFASTKNVELHPENGGWADLRDHELCMNISQSKAFFQSINEFDI